MENRRRAERRSVLWMGRCEVEGESSVLWRGCAIFDVSTLGVGIDLPNPGASELLSRRITALLELGPSVDVAVTGEVRNAESGPDGIVRAGVEFVGLNETELSVVGLLERRAASRSRALRSH
jgi:PilZ domain